MITKYKYANIEEGKRHLKKELGISPSRTRSSRSTHEAILEVSGTTVSVVYSNKFQEVIDNYKLLHIRTQFSEIKGNRQSTLAYDLEVRDIKKVIS